MAAKAQCPAPSSLTHMYASMPALCPCDSVMALDWVGDTMSTGFEYLIDNSSGSPSGPGTYVPLSGFTAPFGGTYMTGMDHHYRIDGIGGLNPLVNNYFHVRATCPMAGTYSSWTTMPITLGLMTNCNQIKGWVNFFDTTSYMGGVRVYLIKYNPSSHILYCPDSVDVMGPAATWPGQTVYEYMFNGASVAMTDSFRVKAKPLTYTAAGFIPTYHDSANYWSSAGVIHHTYPSIDEHQDIKMNMGIATSGPGFIGGDVTMGANRGTAGTIPAKNMLIYLKNSSGKIIQHVYTDNSGHYTFTNLPVGQSYTVYPEAINYATTPRTSISLTSATPSMTAAHFQQHTISMTITPDMVGVNNIPGITGEVKVYPSPASDVLNILYDIPGNEAATVTMTDMAGKIMRSYELPAAQNGLKQLDIVGTPAGLYIVSVRSASVNTNCKIEVIK